MDYAAKGERAQFASALSRALNVIITLSLPAAVGLVLLGKPLISLLFQRGQFTSTQTQQVAWALSWFATGLVAHAALELVTRAFYAVKDSRTPVFAIRADAFLHGIDEINICPLPHTRVGVGRQVGWIQILIDATDVNNARVIRAGIQAVTNFFMQDQGLLTRTNAITAHTRLWFNPGRLESLYIVPGTFAVVLWIFPSLLSAIAIVRERENGTILQVYASSISPIELLLGKGLAYWLIAISEAIVLIAIGMLIFDLKLANQPLSLILGTLLFLADSVLFGLMVGAKAHSQAEAVQGVALIGFVTSLLLSGFIYPLNNIPWPLSIFPNVIPARYFINITRDAFVRGTGWTGVWSDLVMLGIMGLLFFNGCRQGLKRMQLTP